MSDETDVIVTDEDRAEARASVRTASRGSTIGGITLVAVMSLAAATVAPWVVSGLASATPARRRRVHDRLRRARPRRLLAVATTKAIRSGAVSTANERTMKGEARRREFETHLANELEMAEGEPEVLDTSSARLHVDAARPCRSSCCSPTTATRTWSGWSSSSPTGEPPGCSVDSPDQCPAARRSQVQRFADSDALDVCPKLRGRPEGRCSARVRAGVDHGPHRRRHPRDGRRRRRRRRPRRPGPRRRSPTRPAPGSGCTGSWPRPSCRRRPTTSPAS